MKKYKRYFEKKFGKKGFTLIELLAVIVILAIIAVITVPMIMNVIDKAKLTIKSENRIKKNLDLIEKLGST